MKTMLVVCLCCLFAMAAFADETSKAVERVQSAGTVLNEIENAPDKGIPSNLLARAHCIVIVPGLKQAAFIGGAKYGKGFFSCASKSKRGTTSWPSAFFANDPDTLMIASSCLLESSR